MTFFFVFILLSFLILVHEGGHFFAAKLFRIHVEEFGFGFPPRLFAARFGTTTYSVNCLPFGGFVKVHGEQGPEAALVPPGRRSFADAPLAARTIVVLAGVFMNIVFAWVLFSGVLFFGAPRHLVVTEVAKGSPAAVAGVLSDDVVLRAAIGGTIFRDPVSSAEFTSLVREHSGGTLQVSVRRGGGEASYDVAIRESPPKGEGPIGVVVVEAGIDRAPFPANFLQGFLLTISSAWFIATSLIQFFFQLFVGAAPLQSVSGPVGIFQLALGTQAIGLVYFFQLLAFISLNLAVLNLMPFPALDGGRCFFFLVEKLRGGRPVPERVQAAVNGFGMFVLLALMALVTVRDVSRIF